MEGKKVFQKLNKRSTKVSNLLWLAGFAAIVGIIFVFLAEPVIEIDPFFHFHEPDTQKYFYELNSERNQNDGILKNFDYDAIIIGTSMAQNFKTSEFDELFGVNSVKTTFSGGTLRETGDRLKTALASNDEVKMVLRSLDMDFMFMDYDDLGDQAEGEYPTYLYDDNPINDYKYVLNRDIIFGRAYKIKRAADSLQNEPGITDFDTYSNWMGAVWGNFGINSVLEEPLQNYPPPEYGLSDSAKLKIKRNVTYNITDIAQSYPDVEFYYFITPYSAAWWNAHTANGSLARQVQAEQYFIELMLPYDNIHIFTYNVFFDLTMNFNNYKDSGHYGEWVNSAILRWMKDGVGLLTEEDYLEYIWTEYDYYTNFDYTLLNEQEDYDDRLWVEMFEEEWFPDQNEG